MIKKFKFEFEYNDDNDDRCILRAKTSYDGYCIDKLKICKGKLEDRPEWCPLVEIKDDMEKVVIGQWFNPSELTYKGYKARISSEGIGIHGTVTNISNVITFRAMDFDQAQTEFETSVDYYLEFCKKHGRNPEQPKE
jgi:hypothetical protein